MGTKSNQIKSKFLWKLLIFIIGCNNGKKNVKDFLVDGVFYSTDEFLCLLGESILYSRYKSYTINYIND